MSTQNRCTVILLVMLLHLVLFYYTPFVLGWLPASAVNESTCILDNWGNVLPYLIHHFLQYFRQWSTFKKQIPGVFGGTPEAYHIGLRNHLVLSSRAYEVQYLICLGRVEKASYLKLWESLPDSQCWAIRHPESVSCAWCLCWTCMAVVSACYERGPIYCEIWGVMA